MSTTAQPQNPLVGWVQITSPALKIADGFTIAVRHHPLRAGPVEGFRLTQPLALQRSLRITRSLGEQCHFTAGYERPLKDRPFRIITYRGWSVW